MTAVYVAAEIADLFGCSKWQVYQLTARGEFPVEPIHLGRRLVWSRTAVDALLGLTTEADGAQVDEESGGAQVVEWAEGLVAQAGADRVDDAHWAEVSP